VFTKDDYYRDPDAKPNLKALQDNLKVQKELGLLDADIDVGKYTDLSLIEEAAKRLQ
jgi:NitT/TauT family transport system substrate-binding protein